MKSEKRRAPPIDKTKSNIELPRIMLIRSPKSRTQEAANNLKMREVSVTDSIL